MNEDQPQFIRFAEFEIDAAKRVLRRAGSPLALHARAFDLLVFLAANAGRTVSKDELLDAVWENQYVEEANLKVQISALRKALGERTGENRFLVTVPGKGYRFVADIENEKSEIIIEKHKISRLVVEEENEGESRNADRKSISHGRRENPGLFARLFTVRYVAAALLLSVAGAFAFWYFSRSNENRRAVEPVSAAEKQPGIRRLTNQGRVNRVIVSPDGKFFAYTLVERGSFRSEIRLGQTDGASDVEIRPLGDFFYHLISFSADGRSIYCVATEPVGRDKIEQGVFYKMPVLGGAAQKLADGVRASAIVSPDETRIAFHRFNRESRMSSIVTADLDGSNERELVALKPEQTIEEYSLAWSPDASLIAFGASSHVQNNAPVKNFEVFVVNAADGTLRQLTALEWNSLLHLEWHGESRSLFAVGRSRGQFNSSSLWRIDHPPGKVEKLSRDVNRYAGSLSLSEDSTTLVTVQAEIETNLWVAPADNIAAGRQITFSSSGRQDGWNGVDWTPDGKLISTAWVDESLTLWAMDANGANARQLTSIGFRDERPAVVPDGKHIVFQSNRSGATEIWRMTIDGANLQQLTKTGGSSAPSITADGVWVVYRGTGGALWRIPLAGGEPLLITGQNALAPEVSPDGQFVACGLRIEGLLKLAVLPLAGGAARYFDLPKTHGFRTNSNTHWSPDGRFIYYPDEANGIWRQDVKGGAPARLEGIPAEKTFSFAWSRDGKYLTFGRAREVRDAVLLTGY